MTLSATVVWKDYTAEMHTLDPTFK